MGIALSSTSGTVALSTHGSTGLGDGVAAASSAARRERRCRNKGRGEAHPLALSCAESGAVLSLHVIAVVAVVTDVDGLVAGRERRSSGGGESSTAHGDWEIGDGLASESLVPAGAPVRTTEEQPGCMVRGGDWIASFPNKQAWHAGGWLTASVVCPSAQIRERWSSGGEEPHEACSSAFSAAPPGAPRPADAGDAVRIAAGAAGSGVPSGAERSVDVAAPDEPKRWRSSGGGESGGVKGGAETGWAATVAHSAEATCNVLQKAAEVSPASAPLACACSPMQLWLRLCSDGTPSAESAAPCEGWATRPRSATEVSAGFGPRWALWG